MGSRFPSSAWLFGALLGGLIPTGACSSGPEPPTPTCLNPQPIPPYCSANMPAGSGGAPNQSATDNGGSGSSSTVPAAGSSKTTSGSGSGGGASPGGSGGGGGGFPGGNLGSSSGVGLGTADAAVDATVSADGGCSCSSAPEGGTAPDAGGDAIDDGSGSTMPPTDGATDTPEPDSSIALDADDAGEHGDCDP
jgi:hypothetical protein